MRISINETPEKIIKEKLEEEKFYYEHPDMPVPETLDCVDIVMKSKDMAMKIAKGKLNAVTIKETLYYDELLNSQTVMRWIREQIRLGGDKEAIELYTSSLKTVYRLHLHDWKNEWFMDVAVSGYGMAPIEREAIDNLSKLYKFEIEDLKEKLEYEDMKAADPDNELWADQEPEWVYIFGLSKVIATNIVKLKKGNSHNERPANLQLVKGGENFSTNFYMKHPDAPDADDIFCLDMYMHKSEATDIKAGRKHIVFRPANGHYYGELSDKNVDEWVAKVSNEDNVDSGVLYEHVQSLCFVERLHFCDLSDSWYLNMYVEEMGIVTIDDEGIKMLHEEYNCHDMDGQYNKRQELETRDVLDDTEAPRFFFFVLDGIEGTDL